jgi:uncharacterized membrane protein
MLADLAAPAWFAWDPLLPYFASVLVLVLGLAIAFKKAPPHANGLDKLVLCGPAFIAMPMVVFGTEHFVDAQGIGRIIPAWIPAHMFWVYFVGTCLILGGLSIAIQKHARLSAGLFGIMLLCFEVSIHIPNVLADPHNRIIWVVAARDLCFAWGSLAFAAMHTAQWRTKGTHWLISGARLVLGIAVIFFAAEQFLHPESMPGVPLEMHTPTWIPAHLMWSYLIGVVYLVAGLCLVLNKNVRLAAAWIGVAALFVVVFMNLPLTVKNAADIGNGLNYPVDTLLFSGSALCLALSQRKQLVSSQPEDKFAYATKA